MSERNKPKTEQVLVEHQALIDRISKKYYPIIRHAGFDDQTTQTMVLNIALKFLKSLDNIQTNEEAYLNSIVGNAIRDRLRTLKRDRLNVHYKNPTDLEYKVGPTYQPGECNLVLQDIMNTLTVRQQEILRMLIDGYSQVEISSELDLKPSTVNYHIRRLRNNTAIIFGFKSVRSGDDSQDDAHNTLLGQNEGPLGPGDN